MKNWIIHLKIHFPSPIYIILFSCTNATFLHWYALPTPLRQSHGCQCKCTSGAQVHRGGANFAPPLCNSTASDAFTRSSSWRLWNLVQPPWLAAGICWNFSFTKSRLILASTDQPATASMLFNHQCNAATNFLSLTCIHNAAHRSNSWPVKSGNDRSQTFFSNLQCAGLSSYIDVEDFQGVEHCNYYQGLEYCHYHVRMNLLCNAFYPPKGKS